MIFEISQIGITIFAPASFLLVTREEEQLQKVGAVLGCIGIPFWFMMVFYTEQWITIPVHILYTYGWIRKCYVLFVQKEPLL